jgi:hypothetical protein
MTAPLLAIALITLTSVAGYSWFQAERLLREQTARIAKIEKSIEDILGETTRLRIEQSSSSKGPAALLEKLKVYAPMTADARVTEPDFQNALKELKSILRAFESCGEQAWNPITERLQAVDARKDFEETKWLLEIALRLNPPAGKQIAKEVLLGHRLPLPRLRWMAADLLIRHDKPLAGDLLRKILLVESGRGVDMSRAQSQGMQIPDAAAFATTGFHNFVLRYIQSEDEKVEETLTMLLSRVEHDAVTIQECVKELGKRKSKRAVEQIKRLYDNPPLKQENPIFLNHCLRAIHSIEGDAATAWLEDRLRSAPTDTVANLINSLLNKKQG